LIPPTPDKNILHITEKGEKNNKIIIAKKLDIESNNINWDIIYDSPLYINLFIQIAEELIIDKFYNLKFKQEF